MAVWRESQMTGTRTGFHFKGSRRSFFQKCFFILCICSGVNDKLMYLVCTQDIGKQVFTIWSDTDTMQMRFLLSFLVYSRAFEYKDGDLKEMQTIAADTVNAQGSADIHISPDGKFLYASNRLKADGIAIFNIHPDNGMLSKAGYQLTGIHPRNFIITPNGKYLLVACRDSNVIQVYERDADTGLLTDVQQDIKVDKPVCIRFVQ